MNTREKFIFHKNFKYRHFTSTILAGNLKDKTLRDNFLISQNLNPANLVLVNQVHSSDVKIVEKYNCGNFIDNCDGLITTDKSIILGIFTADCVPLLMTNGIVKTAIHAGWRGIHSGIIENAVGILNNKFSINPKDIEVYVGPHIHSCCYEVSRDFENIFNLKLKNNRLDLSEVVFSKLKKLGIVNIFDMNLCTCCQNNYFFSYRRNKTSDRILSLLA
ncbi:MAG: peptidoglycan editing factor PgeF [Endomicrobium sp.]|jgi:YfiH family protein|nr:peptidoglycan editing factor PgeF [Endomicrobium sp.]